MIRKFKDEDTDAVVATWRAASEMAHPFLTKVFLDKQGDAVRNVYLAFAETWVMEVDGEVAGFIALVEDEVGGLFLAPRYHRRGFGTALMDKAVVERGALRVEVFKENPIGRLFYQAYGFRQVDEYFHEDSGEMTVRMAYKPG